MSGYAQWQKRQAGRPMYLYVGLAGLIFGFGLGYKYYYKPWKTRQHLAEAKEYADVLKTHKNQWNT